MTTEDRTSTAGRRLLHRWFVQYNPFYLVSAMLCVAGLRLLSRELTERGSVYGYLGVGAVTEVYAIALIAGAALLTRLGQRRPAVMLALLTALYQGDLALHTEGCTYLGRAGLAASAVWLALFVAKLRALAWAVKVRPSRATFGLVVYGGAGLAIVPQVVSRIDPAPAGFLVALWLFGLAALALESPREVRSLVPLDDWGRTVLRRALRAVWLLWPLLVVLHVVFWSMTLGVTLFALVPAVLLVATRYARGEARVWLVVSTGLGAVALAAPQHFALASLLSAATLALRAYRHVCRVESADVEHPAAPFRREPAPAPATHARSVWAFARTASGARRRMLVGALLAVYLAAWTRAWQGGAWPHHQLWLDVALGVVAVLVVARTRVSLTLLPPAVSYAHVAVLAQLARGPLTALEWGVALTGGAFALLLVSLAASYWLRDVVLPEAVARGASRGAPAERDGALGA